MSDDYGESSENLIYKNKYKYLDVSFQTSSRDFQLVKFVKCGRNLL